MFFLVYRALTGDNEFAGNAVKSTMYNAGESTMYNAHCIFSGYYSLNAVLATTLHV